MEKLNKVITALEQCHRDVKYRDCDCCGYAEAGSECERCLMEDALEVIRGMETKYATAVEAAAIATELAAQVKMDKPMKTGYCPLCDKEIEVRSNYSMGNCPDCGHDVVLHIKGETDV